MRKQFTVDPKLDFVIERFIDAPRHLVWEASSERALASTHVVPSSKSCPPGTPTRTVYHIP
jgi:uncharacterized protein YndB with AHSA1/START domain